MTGTSTNVFLIMAKIIPALTDTAIRNKKPTDKPQRIFDGMQVGLHILIQPSGARLWRLRYTFNGVERRTRLGKYPEVTLVGAREASRSFKEQLKDGIDPTAPIAPVVVNTFESVAEKFIAWKETVLLRSGSTIRKYRECLNNDLLPAIGDKDIANIHAAEIVPLLEEIEKRSNSLARKNSELVSMIIKYAVQRGLRPPYTQLDLSGVIVKRKSKPKVIPKDIRATLRQIDEYSEPAMLYAMKLQFLCFLRSSETMGACWDEFDFETREWHVPACRMKMKRIHVVPLSNQAVSLLQELKQITGDTPFLFPSLHNETAMHRDSLSKAFRSINLKIVPHGCRTLAGTWLRNNEFSPHLVECQLSHAEQNEVAAAYQDQPHLLYLDERHPMMQVWADYLMPE